MGSLMPLGMSFVWASIPRSCSCSSLLVAICTHCCFCIVLPVLVLCTVWPVYTSSFFRAMVEHAQALRQVTDFSAYSLVPTCSGLMMYLAEAHYIRAMLPFLFLMLSGMMCILALATSIIHDACTVSTWHCKLELQRCLV